MVATTTTTTVGFDDVWMWAKDRWPHISLRDLHLDDDKDDSDLGSAVVLATAIVRKEDMRQAPGSETSLLGAALRDIHEAEQGKQPLLAVLDWWANAYDAWDTEASERVYDRIFDGDSAGALALAGTADDGE